MGRTLTDSVWIIGDYVPISAKDKSRIHQIGSKRAKGVFLGFVLRAGGTWSGDLLVAHCEDLQGSEAAEIYVKRFECHEVFAKSSYEFPCANGTLKFLNSPRTSSKAGGNFEPEGDDGDLDIEESDNFFPKFVVHDQRIYSPTS